MVTTRYAYDFMDQKARLRIQRERREISAEIVNGKRTAIVNDTTGRPATYTDENGHTYTYEYDADGYGDGMMIQFKRWQYRGYMYWIIMVVMGGKLLSGIIMEQPIAYDLFYKQVRGRG